MSKTRKLVLFLCFLCGIALNVQAQQDQGVERKLVHPSKAFFVPHWYVKGQAGAAYDIGEAKFTQLVSPALQLALGYQFDELYGIRGRNHLPRR